MSAAGGEWLWLVVRRSGAACGAAGAREYFSVQTYSSVVVEDGIARDAWHPAYRHEAFATVVLSNVDETKFLLSMAQNPVGFAERSRFAGMSYS